MFFSNVGFAVPSFLVATLLIYFVSVKAGWGADERLGGGLATRLAEDPPSLALSLVPMAYFARLVRASMLETMQRDYIRGEGEGAPLAPRRRRPCHAELAHTRDHRRQPLLGYIITSSFIIELIFAIPRDRDVLRDGRRGRDYSVVMGLTVILSVIIIIANLIVDILHGFLDPRIREQGRSRGRRSPASDAARGSSDRRGSEEAGVAEAPIRQASLWRDAWRRYLRNKGALVAGIIFILIVLYAVSRADLSRLTTPTRSTSRRRTSAPTSSTPSAPISSAATSSRGRRWVGVSILIGIGAALFILVIGTLYGSISGFVGGKLDDAMMRFLDALYGLPPPVRDHRAQDRRQRSTPSR